VVIPWIDEYIKLYSSDKGKTAADYGFTEDALDV
jgi:hypothetical protein